MTRLSDDDYRHHIEHESARFRDVLAACDPQARVPSCPDWDADDLLWHLGEVQHFWATMLRQRPAGPDDYSHAPRPETHAGLLAYFDEGAALLAAQLDGVDPTAETWTWSADHTAGFILRRQAHEALIHRLDAELTAGTPTPLDPRLAADGVQEALDVMFGGKPPWGSFTPSEEVVRVDLTDTGDSVWVQLGRFVGTDPEGTTHDVDDIAVVADPRREPDTVVDGPSGALDAWLWRRGGDDEISVAGDRQVHDRFLACVSHPIN
ncbi:maleylpyruvate isomerase family mycothiol-dependent enzyme [Nocardioides sp.]|uniref:maleylpyruvate isomerase family mycothiol-dependent enzyme n=1 Tax=Nocardioides sp. TaxID=35761 RepID=UPI003783F4FC